MASISLGPRLNLNGYPRQRRRKNVHARGRLSGGEMSHGGGKGKGDSQSLLVTVEPQLSVSAQMNEALMAGTVVCW